MLGPRLKALIRRAKLEQKSLANELSLDESTLSRILSGKQPLTIDVVQHITRAAGITVGEFLGEPGYVLPGQLVEALETVLTEARRLPVMPAPPKVRFLDARPTPSETARAPLTYLGIPLAERLADAPESAERTVEIPPRMARAGANAVVEVAGNQWSPWGILKGDHLFVRLTRGLHEADGQVVLCEIDGVPDIMILERSTVQRVRLTSGRETHTQIELEARSPQLRIYGIVVGRLGALDPEMLDRRPTRG